MLCTLKNAVAAGSEGAPTTPTPSATVTLCGSFTHLNVPLLVFAATAAIDPGDDGTLLPVDSPPPAAAAAVSSSSPVVLQNPFTVQTLGAPGSAVDALADEDGSSLPSAFVTFFP